MPIIDEPRNFEDVFFLIPARAGSKGVPRKNLQKIRGKTLIEISIEHAKNVGFLHNIYVSSDSPEILAIAENLKVKKILRTSKESSDTSNANVVVNHFIQVNSLINFPNSTIVYLQPTSPFRDSDLLRSCVTLYKENLKPIVTVRKVVDHPQKMISVENGRIKNYASDFNPTENRQGLLELLIPSGSVYVFSIGNFLENNSQIPLIGAIPVQVYDENALDIDTEYDLLLAQCIGEKYEL